MVVGIGLVRYVGIPRDQQRRLRKLTIVPYFTAILLASLAGLLNPLGVQLLWESALPATVGGQSGLLWLQYYIPPGTEPKRTPGQLARSYLWIGLAAGSGSPLCCRSGTRNHAAPLGDPLVAASLLSRLSSHAAMCALGIDELRQHPAEILLLLRRAEEHALGTRLRPPAVVVNYG